MSYVSRVLEPGETILYSTTLHWRSHLPAIGFLVLAAGCGIASSGTDPGRQAPLLAAAAVFAVLAVASWIPAALRRAAAQFVVTDRRVILKRGILGRHTVEMNRTKVESVDVDQTLLGRLMGYGTVVVHGTGGGLEPIRNIAHPVAFRTHITAGDVPAQDAAPARGAGSG